MKDVFISHANKDKKIAQNICTILEDKGIQCWIAPRDLERGKSFPPEIVKAIKNTIATLLILSKSSNESEDVCREIHNAFNYKKDVFIIRVEEVVPSDFFKYYISSIQWIEATDKSLEESVEELANNLRKLINKTDVRAKPAPGMEESTRKPLKDFEKKQPVETEFSKGFNLRNTLKGHNEVIIGLSWSPDGRYLASASRDKSVKIWDVEKGRQPVFTLEGHTHAVTCGEWSPDQSKIASGSYDNTIKLWDVESGKLIKTFEEHTGTV